MGTVKNIRKLSGASNELVAVDCAERDIQGRKIVDTYATKGEIPTELPANGGNASYATTAGNASKCNNHTLGCDVPANADFTNTWPSAYIATISKSGNTLTITPNTGSAMTFTDTTYSTATTSSAGLMSSSDKTKLNGIESGAEKNKIKEIQLNGTTIAADANGVVNIQSSGGGTTKYTHNIVLYWSGGSGDDYRQGSLSFSFQDTYSYSYATNGYTEDESDVRAFIENRCNLTSGKKYPMNGTVQMGSSSGAHSICFVTNITATGFDLWYIGGAEIYLNANKTVNFASAYNEEINYLSVLIGSCSVKIYDTVV